MPVSPVFDAVVVGGGPRAVAVALRLAARLDDAARPARIAIVDDVEVGAGGTWRTDQPAAYLNNTTASATTIHPDDSTVMSGPPAPGPDLVQWAAAVVGAGGHPHAAWVLDEARELRPWSFPTRRLQGVYYRDQLATAVATGHVVVDEVHGTAVDLVAHPHHTDVRLADGRALAARTVVLAQGMVQSQPDAEVTALADAARRHGLAYVAPGMPAEQAWASLPAGGTILVRGLGANFFDAVGRFVAQWGGTFSPVPGDPHGRLRYSPTGREPVIVAGSGRGIPYRAKPDGTATVPRFVPRRATPEWFAAQAERHDLDFRRDVWPTIAADLAGAHLAALETWAPDALAPDAAEGAASGGGWRSAIDAAETVDDVERALAAAVVDERWAFRLDDLRHPTAGERISADAWGERVQRVVDDELASMSEPARHPRAAVNRAMGALRIPAAKLATTGAVTGESVVRDVHGWFDADGLFLASGPPSHRTRLVLALIEAGVVRLLGPGTVFGVDEERGVFTARSSITGLEAEAPAFFEARMSKGRVPRTSDPLLRALLDSGRARIHALDGVPSASMETTPGTADEAQPHGLNPVAADGTVDASVVVLGIPASTSQPGSAIGATPGVSSPLLAGADVAAKQNLLRRDA